MQDTNNESLTTASASAKAQALLHGALAKAQGQFRQITKNCHVTIRPKEAPAYSFDYADLEELISATRPALSAHGLAVVQSIGVDQQGQGYIDTVLVHADGGSMHSRIPVPRFTALEDPKKLGAVLTYLRRYQYAALLCLAADDDLDQDGGHVDDRAPVSRGAQTSAPKADRPAPDGSAIVSPSEAAWVKKKIEALKLDPVSVLDPHGVKTYDSMTREQFAAVKADLMKR